MSSRVVGLLRYQLGSTSYSSFCRHVGIGFHPHGSPSGCRVVPTRLGRAYRFQSRYRPYPSIYVNCTHRTRHACFRVWKHHQNKKSINTPTSRSRIHRIQSLKWKNEEALRVVAALTAKNPEERLTADSLLADPFFSSLHHGSP